MSQSWIKRTLLLVGFGCFGVLLAAQSAEAYDANWYNTFAKTKAFTCVHPKSKLKKLEIGGAPTSSSGIETVKAVIYYKGWLKKHKMEFEIHTTNIGGKPHVNVNILHDTSSLKRMNCKMVGGWVELQGESPAAGGSTTAPTYNKSWYKTYAKGPAFRCLHPKSKRPRAQVTVGPKTANGIATARVVVTYKGWVKKHRMEFEIHTTNIGGKPHARVNVLQDTNSLKNVICALTSKWTLIQ